jgi:hypothetical protein
MIKIESKEAWCVASLGTHDSLVFSEMFAVRP